MKIKEGVSFGMTKMTENVLLDFENKKEAMSYFIMVLDHICRFGEKSSEGVKFFNPNKQIGSSRIGLEVSWGKRKEEKV
jgi:hypothetical protein